MRSFKEKRYLKRLVDAVIAAPVILGAVTVATYFVVWVYEAGYYSEFHLPREFIVPTITGVFVVGVAICSIAFTSALGGIFNLLALHELSDEEFGLIKERLYAIAVITAGAAFSRLLSFWGITALNGLLLYFWVWRRINFIRRDKGTIVTTTTRVVILNAIQWLQAVLNKRWFVNGYVAFYFLLFIYFLGQDRLGQQTWVSSGLSQQYVVVGVIGDTFATAPLNRHESADELARQDVVVVNPGLRFFRIGDPATPGFVWISARIETPPYAPAVNGWWQTPVRILLYHPGILRALWGD